MAESNLINKIADKNVNIEELTNIVLADVNAREEVVEQLLSNKNIMVYYHCYYILLNASEKSPQLFYKYWNSFTNLLDHKNSYHRDIGLSLIASLTKVDEDNLFSNIFEKYMSHFNDKKFMTAQCFVNNLKKIVKYKKQYVQQIISMLINVDKSCTYPIKQKELLKSNIIEVLDQVYNDFEQKDLIFNFIKVQIMSSSPKTKKRAKEFIKKYNS